MRGSDAGAEQADALDALAMREVVERRIARGGRGGRGGAAVLAFWQDVASRLHERGRVDAASCLLVRKGDVVGLLATLTAALVAALQAEEGWDGARAAAWAADALATVRDWEKRAGARSVEEVAAERGGRAGGYRRLSACRSEPIRPLTRWQRVSECRLVYRLSWANTSLLGAVAQYAGDRSMVCKLNRAVLMQLAAIGSKEVFRAAVLVLEVLGLVVRERQASGKTWWYREGEQRWPRVRMVRYAGPVLLAAVRRAEDEAVDLALKEAEREADGLRRAVERGREDARRTELARRRNAAPLCAVCGGKVWGLGLVGAVDGAESAGCACRRSAGAPRNRDAGGRPDGGVTTVRPRPADSGTRFGRPRFFRATVRRSGNRDGAGSGIPDGRGRGSGTPLNGKEGVGNGTTTVRRTRYAVPRGRGILVVVRGSQPGTAAPSPMSGVGQRRV